MHVVPQVDRFALPPQDGETAPFPDKGTEEEQNLPLTALKIWRIKIYALYLHTRNPKFGRKAQVVKLVDTLL